MVKTKGFIDKPMVWKVLDLLGRITPLRANTKNGSHHMRASRDFGVPSQFT